MSGGAMSINKSVLTPKVTPDAGATMASLRVLGYGTMCSFPDIHTDSYGRPVESLWANNLQILGSGSNAGCYSPEYMIQLGNALRPNYGIYLNVPRGLEEIPDYQSNYRNRPHGADTMDNANRSRSFGLDGSYDMLAPPKLNPSNDADWIKSVQYEDMMSNRMNQNRAFTRSTDTMRAGVY